MYPILKSEYQEFWSNCTNMCNKTRFSHQETHARIQKILSEGVLWQFFFCFVFSWWGVGGSKYHYKRAIIGPPAKRHLNGVSHACWWWPNIECWLGGFVVFQGIWTRIAKKPYIFCDFSGGGSRPHVPPLDPHMRPIYFRALNDKAITMLDGKGSRWSGCIWCLAHSSSRWCCSPSGKYLISCYNFNRSSVSYCKASGLSHVHTHSHTITFLLHQHACTLCKLWDIWCKRLEYHSNV